MTTRLNHWGSTERGLAKGGLAVDSKTFNIQKAVARMSPSFGVWPLGKLWCLATARCLVYGVYVFNLMDGTQ